MGYVKPILSLRDHPEYLVGTYKYMHTNYSPSILSSFQVTQYRKYVFTL